MKKRVLFIILIVTCVVGAIATLGGCGSTVSDADREIEQALVDILVAYNTAYEEYMSATDSYGFESGLTIEFVIDNTVVIMNNNILSISVKTDYLLIYVDDAGANDLIEARWSNNNGIVSIVSKLHGQSNLIADISGFGNTISSLMGDNPYMMIQSGIDDKETYSNICAVLSFCELQKTLKQVAETYNTDKAEYMRSVSYLPAELPLLPEILDVSPYLSKAQRQGYSI